jgi:hypothetical protein
LVETTTAIFQKQNKQTEILEPPWQLRTTSVRSGNDGRLGVVPWGASMSLHSVSHVPIVYLCLRLRAYESGTYAFPHTRKVSRFPLPPTVR